MKTFILLLSAALLSTFSLNACTERNNMSVQQQTEARFKLNPEPKQPYRIKVKINNAPGPMKPINDMYIGYAARNCSYTISRLAGATASPEKNIPIKMNLVGHDEYEVLFYADAVLDEDYFGEGVCQWKPENFGASFKATGKKEETEFNISDVMGNLEKEKTLTKYYWKRGYPYHKNEDGLPDERIAPDFGENTLKGYGPGPHNDNDFFSITVTLEEIKP